ncbi:MAG: 6,7-dimethyl-8-ribityllumazine synthase [Bacteroidia bacterium]|nr:6,7-dimethyl-8-ribityllumazine synthase [Bacteroidia bacterium]MDW8157262.1 6,7-dimethyl-8-ribityllumazine synthase [Bacteroidia bacterium]
MQSTVDSLLQYTGEHDHRHDRIVILQSKWHFEVTELMHKAAREKLMEFGVHHIVRQLVPGSYELPLAAKYFAISQYFDAIICIGCIVKGETPHNVYISDAVAKGIMRVSLDHKLPIIFGILTTDTIEQALARANGTHSNKGAEVAVAALEMIDIMRTTR